MSIAIATVVWKQLICTEKRENNAGHSRLHITCTVSDSERVDRIGRRENNRVDLIGSPAWTAVFVVFSRFFPLSVCLLLFLSRIFLDELKLQFLFHILLYCFDPNTAEKERAFNK